MVLSPHVFKRKVGPKRKKKMVNEEQKIKVQPKIRVGSLHGMKLKYIQG